MHQLNNEREKAMKKLTPVIAAAILLMSIITVSAQEQGEDTLLVHVVTPAGEELSGVVVKLSSGEVTQSFRTNATGWAIFKNIQPGEYDIETLQDALVLNRTTVSFPQTKVVTLIAPLSDLVVKVTDLGGKPVKDLQLKLESASGVFVQFGKTNNDGISTFSEVPYSIVEGLGGSLTITAQLGNLTILEANMTVDQPQENVTIAAELVGLNVTVTNLKGEDIQRTLIVSLESEKFSLRNVVEKSFVAIGMIPTSQLAGEYRISILYPLDEGKNITLYESRRRLDGYTTVSTILDLGELSVRVLDDAGNPLKNLKVIAEVGEAGRLQLGVTDSEGILQVRDLPLSRVAGEYKIIILHGLREVAQAFTTLTSQENEAEIIVERQGFTIQLLDNREKPIAGAELRLVNQITDLEERVVTDELGEATVRSLPGVHLIEINYEGERIDRRTVNLEEDSLRIKLDSVNFPVDIDVRDALGRPVEGLRLRVAVDGDVLLETQLDGVKKQVLVPAPKYVVAEVLSDGEILVRETRYLSEPTTWDIVIKPYIIFGGGLIDIGLIVAAASLILLLIPAAYLVKTTVKKQR